MAPATSASCFLARAHFRHNWWIIGMWEREKNPFAIQYALIEHPSFCFLSAFAAGALCEMYKKFIEATEHRTRSSAHETFKCVLLFIDGKVIGEERTRKEIRFQYNLLIHFIFINPKEMRRPKGMHERARSQCYAAFFTKKIIQQPAPLFDGTYEIDAKEERKKGYDDLIINSSANIN